jgi:hypothetical protein
LKKRLASFAVWGIVITLIIMFLVEFLGRQDLFKGGFQNPLANVSSWYQSVKWPSIEWPWTETPEEKAERVAKENARKEQIRRQTVETRVINILPGQTISVGVGGEYQFETLRGEFCFSLMYQGRRMMSGVEKPGINRRTDKIPVDEIVFYQDPRYPYGEVSIILRTKP